MALMVNGHVPWTIRCQAANPVLSLHATGIANSCVRCYAALYALSRRRTYRSNASNRCFSGIMRLKMKSIGPEYDPGRPCTHACHSKLWGVNFFSVRFLDFGPVDEGRAGAIFRCIPSISTATSGQYTAPPIYTSF